MSDFSSVLGLSGATLQRLGDAYEEYAAALGVQIRQQRERQEPDMLLDEKELLSGSCYVLAAMYRVILDPGEAIPLFGFAADIYRRQNNTFWKLLAICGLNRELLFGQEVSKVEGNPQEFFYELLRQYYLFNSGDENALGRMLEYASSSPALPAQPVGNPPVALREFISFIRGDIEKAYYADEPGENKDWTVSLRVLLQRTAEQLQLLQSHRLPPTNETVLLPFEPDILATLLGFCVRNRNRADLRAFAEQESRHGSPAVFLVGMALEMIDASL
ncbi:MAG TPA: hypothetical protein VKQ52_20020 [Puia sp.]|nr:hypothetical protein [Puia sp.]